MKNWFERNALSPAGWLALSVLVALLVGAVWYAVQAWNAMSGVHITGFGWGTLVLGVLVTVCLGAGLMGLVFYSSRHDMDR